MNKKRPPENSAIFSEYVQLLLEPVNCLSVVVLILILSAPFKFKLLCGCEEPQGSLPALAGLAFYDLLEHTA